MTIHSDTPIELRVGKGRIYEIAAGTHQLVRLEYGHDADGMSWVSVQFWIPSPLVTVHEESDKPL